MPGIVALVGSPHLGRMASALKQMSYLDNYEVTVFPVAPALTLGYVGRASQKDYATWADGEQPRLSVLLYGKIFSSVPSPRRISAREVLEDYRASRFRQLRERYDGSFTIAIVDHEQRQLHVASDRLGTQPLYYRQLRELFGFAPEVKGLMAAAGSDPELSEAGLINLLATGYNLGDCTLFADVHALEPGSVLTYDLTRRTVTRDRYWKIVYEPAAGLVRRGAAAEALFQSTLRAHELHLTDSTRDFDLFLSGGLDSRGILGILDRMGAPPTRALGWGLRYDLPGSDAWIAKRLADEFQVDFSFLPYDTDHFSEIAGEWVYVSELVNDNIGRYGEGMGAIRGFYSTGAEFTFIGDEAWGWRGYAGSETEARAHVMPVSLPPPLRALLRADQGDRLESLYLESIGRIMQACENPDPTDRKDFLYLHGRVARFIFSLGYYREIASEMRRPFLSNEVLEMVRRLPQEHRVHKNLYVHMLRRFLPRTMRYPEMEVPSLPDWSYDLRYKEPVRNYFLQLLDFSRLEDTLLGTMIDRTAFERARDEFFSSQVRPMNRQASRARRITRAIRDSVVTRPRVDRVLTRLRRQMAPSGPTSATDPLWRIALCVLLQRNLGRFRTAST